MAVGVDFDSSPERRNILLRLGELCTRSRGSSAARRCREVAARAGGSVSREGLGRGWDGWERLGRRVGAHFPLLRRPSGPVDASAGPSIVKAAAAGCWEQREATGSDFQGPQRFRESASTNSTRTRRRCERDRIAATHVLGGIGLITLRGVGG